MGERLGGKITQEFDVDKFRQAAQALGAAIDQLPKANHGRLSIRYWNICRREDVDMYGSESLYSIFPKGYRPNISLTAIFHTLHREATVHTKRQLLDLDLNIKIKGIGEKHLSFIKTMQEYVEAEQVLLQNR